jgi:hypothetical protein
VLLSAGFSELKKKLINPVALDLMFVFVVNAYTPKNLFCKYLNQTFVCAGARVSFEHSGMVPQVYF